MAELNGSFNSPSWNRCNHVTNLYLIHQMPHKIKHCKYDSLDGGTQLSMPTFQIKSNQIKNDLLLQITWT